MYDDDLPTHQVGHQTTFDTVQKGFNSAFGAGQKRPFAAITDSRELSNTPPDRVPKVEFVRPQVGAAAPANIRASEIHNVALDPATQRAISEYTQRQLLALTPSSTQDPWLSLANPGYGLPDSLVSNFQKLGIREIFEWQADALRKPGLLTGEQNLVYTAPTGGGKSLVADVLMLKKIIENPDQKAILVLPYVALVQEKSRWLRMVVDGVSKNVSPSQFTSSIPPWKRIDDRSIKIAGFFGGNNRTVNSWDNIDVAVCTFEKANSLINSMLEERVANRPGIEKLGIVVLDELHMVDDDHRGYIMELMATKILSLDEKVQIVGMSATLSNTKVLSEWLHAKYYVSNYRPVPVEEFLVHGNKIFPAPMRSAMMNEDGTGRVDTPTQALAELKPCRIIEKSVHKQLENPVLNAVTALAFETAQAGYGALVFCNSRKKCESNTSILSEVLSGLDVSQEVIEARIQAVTDLRATTTGLDPVLEQSVMSGVAYHHAGLTTDERDIIANAFDTGVIKVIVATCSLAAGINLPARRVILHGARMGRDLLGPAMLRQMRGRAGRKGKDEIGETFLCCEENELEDVLTLLDAEIPPVASSLQLDRRGIERALLEAVTTRLASNIEAINELVRNTLFYHTTEKVKVPEIVCTALTKLETDGLIAKEHTSTSLLYGPTLLGQAIVAACLTPEDGLFLHKEISKALEAFVMDGEMHFLYTLTPINVQTMLQQEPYNTWDIDIDWQVFRNELDRLDESGLRVVKLVGIKPQLILKGAIGARFIEGPYAALIYRRFYTACQLRDLCNEMPVHAVSRKYKIPRGTVQMLSQQCHGFAYGVIKFCERLGWGTLAAALDHMCDRLKAGARADLLELAKLPFVKSRTARAFWDNGFRNLGVVAGAGVEALVPVLMLAQPKRIAPKKEGEGEKAYSEEKYKEKLRMRAEIIIKAANRLWELETAAQYEEE